MRQQSEGLETFSQNFLSALWWLAKLFRTRYQNVFICSFKTNTAKISISSEVWVIFCKFWSKAVKVGTYWMLFAKKLGPVDCKKSWDQLIAKKWDQLIVIKSWDQLIVIKSWDQLIAKKLEPVDCDKKLGPVDCKKMLIAKKSWDQLIPIKGWDQLIAKKDNALFVIRSKTEASIVGLLSQTWGVSFDGRSGKERFPLESFLADK